MDNPSAITPPFGYGPVTPVLKEHRIAFPSTLPAFALTANAMIITAGEMVAAARHYPIIFATQDAGKTFSPLAVLGIDASENLYVSPDGAWAPDHYIPAYVRRHPFCIVAAEAQGSEAAQQVICVEEQVLDPAGEPIFDEAGKPTARWEAVNQFLGLFQEEIARTQAFCSLVAHYKLLEHFEMRATLRTGGDVHLHGMYRLDEKKLELLTASDLRTLIRKGAMSLLYAQFNSQDNFNRLIELKAQREAASQAGTGQTETAA